MMLHTLKNGNQVITLLYELYLQTSFKVPFFTLISQKNNLNCFVVCFLSLVD